MKHTMLAIGFVAGYLQASLPSAFAQAFGEYGRAVGGAAQRHGSSGSKMARPSGPSRKVNGAINGVGYLGVQPLQKRLVVTANGASLYPGQDDETQKIQDLSQGVILIPVMYATSGSNGWYMVKTEKGTTGWVKSVEVREEQAKK
jgi:hypothetical protein